MKTFAFVLVLAVLALSWVWPDHTSLLDCFEVSKGCRVAPVWGWNED